MLPHPALQGTRPKHRKSGCCASLPLPFPSPLALLGKRAGGALPATAESPAAWTGVGTAHLPLYLEAKFVPCSICWGGNGSCHRKGLHKGGAKGHYVTAISPPRKQRSQKHHQTLPGNLIPYLETTQGTVTGPNPAGKAEIRSCLHALRRNSFPFFR